MFWKLVLLIGLFWIGKKLILVWNLFFKVCPTFGDNGSVGYGGGENIVWLSSVGWSLPVVFRDTVRTTWWLGSNELKWITFSGLVGSNNTYQVPLLTPTGDLKIYFFFVQFGISAGKSVVKISLWVVLFIFGLHINPLRLKKTKVLVALLEENKRN